MMFTSAAARKAALGLDGQQLRGRNLRITNISGGGGVRGKKVASWQDTKSKPAKFDPRRSSSGTPGRGSTGKKKKGGVEKVQGKRKKDGKRPAVMARKMAQKAKSKK